MHMNDEGGTKSMFMGKHLALALVHARTLCILHVDLTHISSALGAYLTMMMIVWRC